MKQLTSWLLSTIASLTMRALNMSWKSVTPNVLSGKENTSNYVFDYCFVDLVAPHAYETSMLRTRGLGGSESTMIKVCEGLALNNKVACFQSHMKACIMGENAVYIDASTFSESYAKFIIHMRAFSMPVCQSSIESKHFLWMHDLIVPDNMHIIKAFHIPIIVVSRFHKKWLQERTAYENIHVIYNPIHDNVFNLSRHNVTYNKLKLSFMSSPHKDLDHVIHLVGELREQSKLPFELHCFNPGYINAKIDSPFVYNHGSVSNIEMLKEISDSLCVFMPMNKWLETFCIVAAEANAIGVPVIALKKRDALDETGGDYLCNTDAHCIERVMKFYKNGRPKVKGNLDFALSKIIKRWENICQT